MKKNNISTLWKKCPVCGHKHCNDESTCETCAGVKDKDKLKYRLHKQRQRFFAKRVRRLTSNKYSDFDAELNDQLYPDTRIVYMPTYDGR